MLEIDETPPASLSNNQRGGKKACSTVMLEDPYKLTTVCLGFHLLCISFSFAFRFLSFSFQLLFLNFHFVSLCGDLGTCSWLFLHSFRRGQASILSIYCLYFPSNIGNLRYEFTYFLYEIEHTQHVYCNQWELETQVINLCIIGSTSRSRTFELLTSDQTMHINPNFILYHFLLSSPFCASVQKPLCPGDL